MRWWTDEDDGTYFIRIILQVNFLEQLYWCEYNFTEEQCGRQLEILIEAWTFTNTMVRKRDSFKGTGSGDRRNDKIYKNSY
jgi:hypothetical protein